MPNTVAIPRLQAEVDMAQRALGAAQYERANYVRFAPSTPSAMAAFDLGSSYAPAAQAAAAAVHVSGDPATIAVLDLRVSQAQATLAAAQAALAAALA